MTTPPSTDDFSAGPAGGLLQHLWKLNHALEQSSLRMKSAFGITTQQRMMIRTVGKYPGITASQLAALFHLDGSTVSSALDRLERNGWLERRRGHRDRRRVTLGLTAKGRAMDRDAADPLSTALQSLLKTVGPEDLSSASKVFEALGEIVAVQATLIGDSSASAWSNSGRARANSSPVPTK